MKKNIIAVLTVAALAISLHSTAFAADKEKTIQGEGTCAKCDLHKSETCQNVIRVEKDGKKTTYYLVQNDVSKEFHKNVCKAPAKVKATGTVKEVDGKMELTPSKIELVK